MNPNNSIIMNPKFDEDIDPQSKEGWCHSIKKSFERLPLYFMGDDKINLSASEDNGTEKPKKKSFFETYYWYQIIGTIFLVQILLISFSPSIKQKLIKTFDYYLGDMRRFAKRNPITSMTIFWFANFLSTFLFPSKGLPMILIAFIQKKFVCSQILNMTSTIASLFFGYYLAKACFNKRFVSKLNENLKFKAVLEMVNETPWTFSYFIWFSYIPMPTKVLQYPLTNVSCFTYISTGSLVLGFGVQISTMIGYTLDEIVSLFELQWNEQSYLLKSAGVLSQFEIIFTLVFMWYYGTVFNKKFKRIRFENQKFENNNQEFKRSHKTQLYNQGEEEGSDSNEHDSQQSSEKKHDFAVYRETKSLDHSLINCKVKEDITFGGY